MQLPMDHEHLPVMAHYRYYMVGKLVRQDLGGSDPAYRETATCPIHEGEPVRVIGPRSHGARYSATCPAEHRFYADSMQELWQYLTAHE